MTNENDLIRRADAIEAVEARIKWFNGDAIEDRCKRDAFIQVIDDVLSALPSAEAAQGWIPCSERLPDNKTYVLTTIQVSGRQPHARSGFYHDGFFHNDNGDTWKATDREVRAWMPLPKPYKAEREDK